MRHNPGVHPIAITAAALAALIHVYFFVLESMWFGRPTVYRRFGLATDEEAETVRSFAYNQGWYNLFLAVGVVVGIVLAVVGDPVSGRAITLFACGSMIAAGLVLVVHDPSFLRAAMIQALPPVAAVLAVVFLG
jgi:putative membrane protein